MTAVREQYLEAWRVFVELNDNVTGELWGASTPCLDWTVRALIGHVVDGADQVVAMLTGQDPLIPVQDRNKLERLAGPGCVRAAAAAVQAALTKLPDDAELLTPAGTLPLEQMLGMALIEPVAHGWDLAVATGQQVEFDADSLTALLQGVQHLGGQLAATGMYHPATRADELAPPLERLMAALGRTTR